jgi:UDP:flavonoid glycosyltransferase YjiC (YdhE family)
MPQRVLLAWELGGGRGHVLILGWIAEVLRQRGFEPVFAVQRLDALDAIRTTMGRGEFYQAPVWLGTLDRRASATHGASFTVGDVIADLGLRTPFIVEHMIESWDSLLARINPAAVVADFAPACLLAARGRLPAIAVGDGFTLPPNTLEQFPQFEPGEQAPKYKEETLTEVVNACLRASDRPPIARLPEIFGADRYCAGAFTEFDPYASERRIPTAAPWVPVWDRTVPTGGDEVFGYFSVNIDTLPTVTEALARVASEGLHVRVHIPALNEESRTDLAASGVIVEPEPLPFEDIQRRARLVVSFGSLGLVSCALTAGIPQVVLPLGIAKSVTGRAVERLGVGRWLNLKPGNPLEPALLSQAIVEIYRDEKLAAAAKSRAPDFARRLAPRPAEIVADFVQELV